MAMGQVNREGEKRKKEPRLLLTAMTLLERHAECDVERVEGIEPSTKAWEAFVLPLNYTRVCAALFTRTLQELEAQVIKKLVGTL